MRQLLFFLRVSLVNAVFWLKSCILFFAAFQVFVSFFFPLMSLKKMKLVIGYFFHAV